MNSVREIIFWAIVFFIVPSVFATILYNPLDLVTPMRIDIMAKYIYAKSRELGVESMWPLEVYENHLKVWNGCIEIEDHGARISKHNFLEYLNSFNLLLDSVKKNGFCDSFSIIPVGSTCIVNGGHRVAACLLYNKSVLGEPVQEQGVFASASYLKKRTKFTPEGLKEKYLDAMALQYCELKQNTYMIFMFPCIDWCSIDGVDSDAILNTFGSIVYKKTIKLSENGLLNLTKLMHKNARWLGDYNNNFVGARRYIRKIKSLTEDTNKIAVYLFECPHLELVYACKNKICELFKIGSWPIYISNNHKETVALAQAVFNRNSICFLNEARQKFCKNFERYLSKFKIFLQAHIAFPECFCVGSDAVLSAYGMKDCDVLEFIHHGYDDVQLLAGKYVRYHSCNKDLKYYSEIKDDIIFNPENHFYYNNLKFAALHVIKSMKKLRHEKKDIEDLNLINNHLAHKQVKK
jgi:hypothetical protein